VPLGIVLPAGGDWVDSLAIGPDGNVWFTDCHDSRIGKVTPGGEVTEYPTPSACIVEEGVDGIAAGPDGNVWFTMWHSAVLGRVTPSGEITEYQDGGCEGIVTGPDGNLWVANQVGRVDVLAPTGTIIFTVQTRTTTSVSSAPNAVVAGPDGAVWFTDLGEPQVGRITSDGALTTFPTSGKTNFITAGSDGNVWFTEAQANMLGRITPAGALTEFTVPTPNVVPEAIAAGSDGNVWFTEYDGVNYVNTIGRISPSGEIVEFGNGYGSTSIITGPDGLLWNGPRAAGNIARIRPSAP
jgi:streptogramin lyase